MEPNTIGFRLVVAELTGAMNDIRIEWQPRPERRSIGPGLRPNVLRLRNHLHAWSRRKVNVTSGF
jgi:hypothetical protein